MDQLDERLLGLLRQNARMSVSEIAARLGVSRTTARARIERLEARGVVLGYSAILPQDLQHAPVRGIMSLSIEGRGKNRIVHQLKGFSATRAVHSTNGKWDLIVELGVDRLEELEDVLNDIREISGVSSSETSLLLATHIGRAATRDPQG